MGPGLAGVGGLVDTVANREVRPVKSLAASDVNDVRIRLRNCDSADRPCRLIVEDRHPRAAGIVRFPYTAVHRRGVERMRLRRHTDQSTRAASSQGADTAPMQHRRYVRDIL